MKSKQATPGRTRKRHKPARKATRRKRVFIVEDHPVFREGLLQILNGEADFKVCGTAGSAETALRAITRLSPDLVIVDISLPGKSGVELIRRVRRANGEVKLLAVSMHQEALYADRVLRAGGDGFIMKQEDPGEILHAMRDVLAGHIYLSEAVLAGRAPDQIKSENESRTRPLSQLTDSELEILELLGRRLSDQEIAGELGLSLKALRTCCRRIQNKLKLQNRGALVQAAVSWSKAARQ